jgi:hypothetical protein
MGNHTEYVYIFRVGVECSTRFVFNFELPFTQLGLHQFHEEITHIWEGMLVDLGQQVTRGHFCGGGRNSWISSANSNRCSKFFARPTSCALSA